jgi:phage terminase large subunit
MTLAKSYYQVKGSRARIQVHQGGTRSGKTYSILTALIELCWQNENSGAVITIARKTLPALKASAMRDFFEIIEREGLYSPDLHNKSEGTYYLYGNLVEFISVDQPQKVRGRKRDILFINEANELSLEDWRQLLLRTTGQVIIDFNPSDEFHWIYDHVLTRDDVDFFQTTYLDNPFLSPSVVQEIERLRLADENYWRVYGLGERGASRSTVFTHWTQTEQIPEGFKLINYGLDFGFTNDPTALVACYSDGHGYLFQERIFRTGLSNREIYQLAKDIGSVPVIADSAEPKSINELHGYGMNVHPARKGPDSVRSGIQFLQSRPLLVTSDSLNIIKELRNYKWREDKNGKVLNEPVDVFNHTIDAMRYSATFNQANPNFGKYSIG